MSEKKTYHAVHPARDGDKCVCGVRLSDKPETRVAAASPSELTCERCYLRSLRSWQKIDPNMSPILLDWPSWPWLDPRFTYADDEA